MKKEKIYKSIIAVLCIILVIVLGLIFTKQGMNWFNGLNKPSQWVPSPTFIIVWTMIYFIYAITLVLLINQNLLNRCLIYLFILNGILNILWCLMFFTYHNLLGGQIIIVFNLIFSFLLANNLLKYFKAKGYILFIYPLWLCIAICLNLATWILN